jgi:uncharacterized protein (TIGR02646 family)
MKHIIKRAEPKEFQEWKAKANADWQPTYDDLRDPEKPVVKQALMAEQGFLCCYCERRLIDEDSHIEHFRPQNDPQVDALDYGNLLCSCQNKIPKGAPRHCGNLKNGWFDAQQLISPLQPGCEKRFSYSGDGMIRAAKQGDEPARVTIEKLGLAIPKLNDLREKAIEPFLDPELSDSDFRQFVAAYLCIDAEGRFGEFWTTIRHLFGAQAFHE